MPRSSTSFVKGDPTIPKTRGRPPITQEQRDAREICRALTPMAVATLENICADKTAPAAARVSAAQAILDRGHGKPPQTHEIPASGNTALEVVGIRMVFVGAPTLD